MKRRLPRAVLVILAMVIYTAASRVLGEQYPVGPLSMFSGGLRASSRIVARTRDGRLCELSSFESWRCDGPIDFRASANPQCTVAVEHAENDRKAESLLRKSAGDKQDGAPVEVIRRIFHIPRPGDSVAVEDCVLAACTAREVPGACVSTL